VFITVAFFFYCVCVCASKFDLNASLQNEPTASSCAPIIGVRSGSEMEFYKRERGRLQAPTYFETNNNSCAAVRRGRFLARRINIVRENKEERGRMWGGGFGRAPQCE